MAERTLARFEDPTWQPQFFARGASDNDFFVVSPNSRRMAFLVRKPEGWSRSRQFVVLDGEPHKHYSAVQGRSLIFSSDSHYLAYAAREAKKWLVVVDGVEGESFDAVAGLCFSPHGGRLAYMAEKSGFLRRAQTVVIDGRTQKFYESIGQGSLSFSPNGHHVAFAARRGKKWTVVVDGQEGKSYERVSNAVFGPVGRQIAYVAGEGEKAFVVLEGKEHPRCHGIGALVFSADGTRFAYEAQKAGKWLVVLDGKEGQAFDGVGEGSLVFSPDGRHLAYVGGSENKQFVVLDGRKLATYDGVLKGGVRFSPDSSRLAYGAGARGKALVIVDGEPQGTYERIWTETIQFSPDSRRLCYLARNRDGALLVVDGKEGKSYEKIDPDSVGFSPNNLHVAYVAEVNGEWVLVMDGQEQEPYERVRCPVFSPEGESVVYVASRTETVSVTERVGNLASVSRERMFVVSDGRRGKTYDQILLSRGAHIMFDDQARFHYLAAHLGSFEEELPLPMLTGSHYLLVEDSLR